ncbi:uncharacterized protein EI90DRAFT_3020861 [Cantharellus anzutake]|uniref:uncharacterized protein n=1 Tax=Cantharellus anzutake TaxID=1750568 RepID=UPI00190818E0|nr:uncharacterized protein EI90DRAFT_3020861 [Cantharellus anzutake]KAF8319159.1 hypothetical protein EI90DRAFT_3020861 [Cantharellus anzutake]
MNAFVKQWENGGYSQGCNAFFNLIAVKWFKENGIMDLLVEETKNAECYPFSVLMEEPDLLTCDSIQLLPTLELEVSQIGAWGRQCLDKALDRIFPGGNLVAGCQGTVP